MIKPLIQQKVNIFFLQLADECLDKKNSAEYNQSIMDFGATVCKPVPLCNVCPLNKTCIAFNQNKTNVLPVKSKKLVKKDRWFSYFIFSIGNKKYVQLRTAKDIWQNLHEFYLVETKINSEWNESSIKKFLLKELDIQETNSITIIKAQPQILTHQKVYGYFIIAELLRKPASLNTMQGEWLSSAEIKTKAFPRFIHQYISAKAALQQELSI